MATLAQKIRAALALDPEAFGEVWIHEADASDDDSARAVALTAKDLATIADALEPAATVHRVVVSENAPRTKTGKHRLQYGELRASFMSALASGPKTISQIADETGAAVKSLWAATPHYLSRGEIVKTPASDATGGRVLFGLPAKAAE